MTRRIQLLLPAVVCLSVLPVLALWVHPWVELGIVDDWSYIRSSQVLAQTGHIVYNGWATAMIGWQLYVGALLIKLFGFSFSVTRVGTLLFAMLTAVLMQRVLVRLGITEWNSAAATLVFLISPVFLAVTFSFMSDVYGMLVLIGCCYGCIRAVQASSEARAAAWVCAAALGTAVGGTARQIAWVGLVAMVPSTIWLLRKSRMVVSQGLLCTLAGGAFVAWSLHWFALQPYSIPEHIKPAIMPGMKMIFVHRLPGFVGLGAGEILLLTAPLLLLFTPSIFRSRRTLQLLGACLLLAVVLAAVLYKTHRSQLFGDLLIPYFYNNLWYTGFEDFPAYLGSLPLLLTRHVRVVVTAVICTGGFGLLSTTLIGARTGRSAAEPAPEGTSLVWRNACTLLLPCTAAYLALLLPRQLGSGLLDRYFLFPEFVVLVFAALLYQRNIGRQFSRIIWLLIALTAALDTAGMHDTFALYRAQTALLGELTSQGVPRTDIDGGFQYNGWTEVVSTGHMNESRIQTPAGAYQSTPTILKDDPCHTLYLEEVPSIKAHYVVSLDPNACGGPSRFAPVTFSTFFSPHKRVIYAVLGPYRSAP